VAVTAAYAGKTATAISAGLTVEANAPTVTVGTVLGTALPNSGVLYVNPTVSPSDATITYQWRRDGTDIPGATNFYYYPTAADAGQSLAVAVTASSGGLATTAVSESVAAGPVIQALSHSGAAQVGYYLLVQATVVPTDATLTYQWRRNGTVISGATDFYYLSTQADLGTNLSVVVTATYAGLSTSYTSANFLVGL
jgi:hypothetical protein